MQAYMWGVSALLDDSMIEGLAEYYASQTPAPGKVGNTKLVATGRKIYDEGIPARGVRACGSCHGAHAEGASVFPRLAGQNAPYVFGQLKVFGTRLRPHGQTAVIAPPVDTTAEVQNYGELVEGFSEALDRAERSNDWVLVVADRRSGE